MPRDLQRFPSARPNNTPQLNPDGVNWVPGQRSGLGIQVDSLRDASYHLGVAQSAIQLGASALGIVSAVHRLSAGPTLPPRPRRLY